MKRTQWLTAATFTLLVAYVGWFFWSNRGLVTIQSDDRPLSEIIRSIEKQGGITVKTDLDQSMPVRMHVEKVKLAEALETLSTLTDARWRLTYLVAADKGAIAGALGMFTAGQKVDGWKMLSVSVPPIGEEPLVPPDPRSDPWEVKPAKEAKLQAYLQQASRSVSASFIYPETWNPDVTAPPKSGPIAKSLPRLAKSASGQYEEVFLLQRTGRGDGPGGDEGGGPRFASFDGGGRGGFGRERGDREGMEERIQAEIAKLPSSERATAQKEHDERKKFFEDMRNLKPEERMAKMEEFMSDPKNEERMDKGQAARDSRRSPEQRTQRAQKYRERKQAAISGGKQ